MTKRKSQSDLQQTGLRRRVAERLASDHLSAVWEFRTSGVAGRSLSRLPFEAVTIPLIEEPLIAANQFSVAATCAAVRSVLRNPRVPLRNVRPLYLSAEFLGFWHKPVNPSESLGHNAASGPSGLGLVESAQMAHAAKLLLEAIRPFADEERRRRNFSVTGYSDMGTAGKRLGELVEPNEAPTSADVFSVLRLGSAEQAARDVETLMSGPDLRRELLAPAIYSIRRLHRIAELSSAAGFDGFTVPDKNGLESALEQLEVASDLAVVASVFGPPTPEAKEGPLSVPFFTWWQSMVGGLDITTDPGAYLSEYVSAEFALAHIIQLCHQRLKSWLDEGDDCDKGFSDLRVDVATNPHPFALYWVLEGLSSVADDNCVTAIQRLAQSAQADYYRLVACSTVGSAAVDMVRLGFHLLVDLKFACEPDQIVARAAWTQLAARQPRNGIWPKGDRLWTSPDHGDVYGSSVELMAYLLPLLSSADLLVEDFEVCVDRLIDWLEDNNLNNAGKPRAWRSPEASHGGSADPLFTIESYSLLLSVIAHYNRKASILAAEKYNGITFERDPAALTRLRDVLGDIRRGNSEVRNSPASKVEIEVPMVESVGELLAKRIITPLETSPNSLRFVLSARADRARRIRSGILYGPPGTGKTTLVRRMAEALGWPFLQLSPAHFIRPATNGFAESADRIFSDLKQLRDCVVLFDEMDGLLRSREPRAEWVHSDSFLRSGEIRGALATGDVSEASAEESLWTTVMLPLLQDLHDEANLLFFVATNYYQRLDPAAVRPGRFDFRLQLLPPTNNTKISRILVPETKSALQLGPEATAALSESCYHVLCQPGAYAIHHGLSSPRRYELLDSQAADRRRNREREDGIYWQQFSISSPQGEIIKSVFPVADYFEYFTVANTYEVVDILAKDEAMRGFDSWARDPAHVANLKSAILRAVASVVPVWFGWDPERDMLAWSGLGHGV